MIYKNVQKLNQWWSQLSFRKKDRLFAFAALIASFIFVFALFLDITHLLSKEKKREAINTMQILEILALKIKSDLQKTQDELWHIALNIDTKENSEIAFFQSIEKFTTQKHSEITAYYWQDKKHSYVYSQNNIQTESLPFKEIQSEILKLLDEEKLSNTQKSLSYSKFLFSAPNKATVYLSIVSGSNQDHAGILAVTFNLDRLLQKHLISQKDYALDIWLENSQEKTPSTASGQPALVSQGADQQNTSRFTINISDIPLTLAAKPKQKTFTNTIEKTLLGISICMGLIVIFVLLFGRQFTRMSAKAQQQASQEANFRLAIEKSMVVGLKAIDYSGRVIYVNPAFCKMTTYTEEELIGSTPPYPYWPVAMQKHLTEIIQGDISKNPAASNGFDIEFQRRNGESFYARVYMSALIDIHGHQNGWITTMTDITEMQQAREELILAGKRFTTVLESLDTLISVVSVGNNELLFTNCAYKNYFGNKTQGHLVFTRNLQQNIDPGLTQHLSSHKAEQLNHNQIDNQDSNAGKNKHDIYIDMVERWFDIRERYLAWVDGRLAHMIFATDVTERHLAQEQSNKLHQRTQEVSRLITMGEMASSIAHELNQPLTAINNYCSGLISRLKTDQLSQDSLIETLGKTSKQAIRAGQIIQRIRSYVQQSTPPQRILISATQMMDNVRELAEIDTKRHNINLSVTIEEGLPSVYADPLLIEQVLLNLIRNAIDAIETANRPVGQRFIDIRIHKDATSQKPHYVDFSVIDSGTGIIDEVQKEIFMPFFTTKKNGLGIGLNLCHSIIESHGGSLHIKNINKDDQLIGCCFSFSLPIENSQNAG